MMSIIMWCASSNLYRWTIFININKLNKNGGTKMKMKIVLIAIALIAMIGTAAANPSFMKITPEGIVIAPDGTTTTSVEVLVYDYNWDAGTPQNRYISGYSSISTVQIRLSVDSGVTWTDWTTGAGSANREGATYSVIPCMVYGNSKKGNLPKMIN
ncbi:MAG TPA: hypothetical protein C5S51_08005, partial [Methanosarcinaceae archaeon]|nr:hypothetical protein [Methanosarcinaceae archaeon]